MTDQVLDSVTVEPVRTARSSVIWLHGLGADGHDFEPVVPMLQIPDELGVRFVFPHAPSQPVTINGGMVMPAWYDIYGLTGPLKEDDAGIRASERLVHRLIEREVAEGIPHSNIILAGFSQGGAIAVHTGIRYPHRLAGIMMLSSYLPLVPTVGAERRLENRETPIFIAHGSEDQMLPFGFGRQSEKFLSDLGYSVSWHAYPMGHEVCPEELVHIGAWLKRVLAV